jgi:hypothetical protein
MAQVHVKVASVAVEAGNPVFTIYGPSINGAPQPVLATKTVALDAIDEAHPKLYDHLAALGFAAIAQQRYTLKGEDGERPDAVKEIDTLYAKFLDGSWHPGRDTGPRIPSTLVEAMASLSGVPTHVIEEKMKDKTTFTKSFLLQLRKDPPIAAKMAAIEKARAEEAEKAAKLAGKSAKETVNLGALFGAVGQVGAEAAQ